MTMKLPKLQNNNKKARKLRLERLSKGYKDIEKVFYYQGFPYVLKIICAELINKHYHNPLVGYFSIEMTWELIARKYYWPIVQRDVEAYVKGCDVCLASKIVWYKPYADLQPLPVLTHWWKNLSIDFVTSLSISTN